MNTKRKRIATALVIASAVWLTACGSSQDPWNPNGPYGPYGPNAGCIPIQQGVQTIIPFTGNGVYVDSANVVGGQIPGSMQTFGTMTVGGGGGGQYNTLPNLVDGRLSMNISLPGQNPFNMMGQPGTTTNPYYQPCAFGYCPGSYNQPMIGWNQYSPTTGATVSGAVQLSEITKQDILSSVAMGRIPVGGTNVNPWQPVPGVGGSPIYNQPQVCVSGIAINSGRWDSWQYGPLLYDAKVYLYMNGTQHGYMLYF